MKKKTIAIAAMLLAASLCFGLAACGSGVSLKDFPAETEETAELGSVYELRTQVEGEDGTTYRLSSQVVTQDGGAVPVFENSFDVSDVSGYTITYTALISDTETQQSVVTLSVTDNTAPVININKPDDGIVNTEYRLPEISVSDLAGTQPAVTVKVYLVEGDSKTEVAGLTEREGRYYFTPSALGNYQIEVTASKANGQSKTATRTFIIDQPVLEGEVFSPDVFDPAAQVEVRLNTGDTSIDLTKLSVERRSPTQEESETAAYKGNYLKIDGSQIGSGWVNFYLTPRQEEEVYGAYDKVSVWLYFEADESSSVWNSLFNNNGYRGYYAANTWQLILVDREAFVENVSGTFLSLRFNSDGNANFDNLKALRIGTIAAVNDEDITAHETMLVPPVPEDRYGRAGETFKIPSAQVMVDGLIDPSITSTLSSATFTQNLPGSTPETIGGSAFTPLTGGTLSATFGYEAASNQSIDVSYTISSAQAAGNVVFSPATANGRVSMHVNDNARISAKAGDAEATYQGSYLEVRNNGTGWNNLYLNLDLAADAYSDYDQFGLWVYFDAEEGSTVRTSLFNSVRQVYAADTWYCVLVDRALFMDNIADLHVLFTAQFGVDNSINFDNLQAIRLGEIVALNNDTDKAIVVDSEQVVDCTVLQSYTIPTAHVTNGESATAETTVMFRQSFNGEPLTTLENAQGEIDLSALGSGTLYVIYTCDGGMSKTVTVNIASVTNDTGALLDMRSADVLANVRTNDATTKVTYQMGDAENGYISWTDVNSATSAWPNILIDFKTTQQVLQDQGVAYLKVEVYYQTNGTRGITGYFCANGTFKVGSDQDDDKNLQIPRNQWYTVYIPISYMTDAILGQDTDFMRVRFNLSGNGNFDNVQEVRLKGFVPVTEAEVEETYSYFAPAEGETTEGIVTKDNKGSVSLVTTELQGETAPYLSWKGNTQDGWDQLVIGSRYPDHNAFELYDYVAVEVKYVTADEAPTIISGYFAGGQCTIGTTNTSDQDGIESMRWVTVYMPIEQFYMTGGVSGVLEGGNYLISCGFTGTGAHFPQVEEVRIGKIYFTNEEPSNYVEANKAGYVYMDADLPEQQA